MYVDITISAGKRDPNDAKKIIIKGLKASSRAGENLWKINPGPERRKTPGRRILMGIR
jgi:hypothetical protein